MARKKKTEKVLAPEPVSGKPIAKVDEIIWVEPSKSPGTVLGRVYDNVDDDIHEPCRARLVYISKKFKFIVE